jgi:hypothetical protein
MSVGGFESQPKLMLRTELPLYVGLILGITANRLWGSGLSATPRVAYPLSSKSDIKDISVFKTTHNAVSINRVWIIRGYVSSQSMWCPRDILNFGHTVQFSVHPSVKIFFSGSTVTSL